MPPDGHMQSDGTDSLICPACEGRGFDPAGTEAADRNPDPTRTCFTCEGAGSIGAALHALLTTPVAFGLRAQGHLPTIDRMLDEGASWQEIGKAIGWDWATARDWYERERVEEQAALRAHARGEHRGLATAPPRCRACEKFGPNGERYRGAS